MSSTSSTPRENIAIPSAFRVLVVDDVESVRIALARLLATKGHQTVTAESGAAALALLRSQYFDVMLCDVRMPGMSGLELLTEAMLLDRDLPVLMLTGVNDVSTARDALARGAMDYLKKPIELSELDQAVRAAAQQRRVIAKRTPVAGMAAIDAENIELRGGPLAARWVPMRESRYRLWVVMQPDGEHVWAGQEAPSGLPAGSALTGFYSYSRDERAMLWEARDK